MRSILTRRSNRRDWFGERADRDQSAPSEFATTDVAWQALLQNSRPTLTHLEAGVGGGTYAGGGPRSCRCDASEVGWVDAICAGGTLRLGTLNPWDERGLVVVLVSSREILATFGGSSSEVAMCPGGAPANITRPP